MAKKLPSGLTALEERACRELMKDVTDQTAAFKRAGSKAKPAALRSGASRLFAKPAAKKFLASLMEKRNESVEADAVWVLKRLLDEANADLADIYAEDGTLLPVHEMPEVWRKGLLAGVEIEETKVKGKVVSRSVKVKQDSRLKRLELIGKHVNVRAFRDQLGLSNPDGTPLQPPVIQFVRDADPA